MKYNVEAVNTIRALSIDAVNAANSGHPGLPMGAAPMAYVLFKNHLRFKPSEPKWRNRDRFILSAGHGSALLYSLLYLFGYDVSLDDLKNFRQLGSPTAGHPEYGHLPGVEVTTGPLGQGIASSVGFAIAASKSKADNYTYVICGDGDLMEGISSEASSLAGRLSLGKLIVLYDDNSITIDGSTDIAWKENVLKRYEAYGWNTLQVDDGNDMEAIDEAITKAKSSEKPTIISVKTIIGYGSDKVAGTSAAHGAPLGEEEGKKAKVNLGMDPEKTFYVSDEVRAHFEEIIKEKEALEDPKHEVIETVFPQDLFDKLVDEKRKDNATRNHSEVVINAMAEVMPNLLGGSADLASSNKSMIKTDGYYGKEDLKARNIAFGIREHAMAAIVNGITLYGEHRAFGATFLTFADYMKPSIRLAALMDIGSMFVFTHDSIGVGEDGPTHQPIEHLAMLRTIPGMRVYRPADFRETVVSYRQMINEPGPSCIALTRQNLPELDIDRGDENKGAYIVRKEKENPELILMASGSEVSLALEVAEALEEKIDIRVISMLSMEVFKKQSKEYVRSLLPDTCRKRYAIEAASPASWYEFIGLEGDGTFMHGFGASGEASAVFKHFGFDKDTIVERVEEYYGKS